jgi:hypothetical protein
MAKNNKNGAGLPGPLRGRYGNAANGSGSVTRAIAAVHGRLSDGYELSVRPPNGHPGVVTVDLVNLEEGGKLHSYMFDTDPRRPGRIKTVTSDRAGHEPARDLTVAAAVNHVIGDIASQYGHIIAPRTPARAPAAECDSLPRLVNVPADFAP